MKKYLLFFAVMFLATAGFAQNAFVLNRIDTKEDFEKRSRGIKERLLHERRSELEQNRDGEITTTSILSEDFSKFTAGSEDTPDTTPLDNIEDGTISDEYFNTPGWLGFEVYQAGGCAFLDVNGETGMLITPMVNTEGNVTIKCRAKSVAAEGDYFCYNLLNEYSEPLTIEYTYIPGNEWVDVEFAATGLENSYVILFAMYDAVFIDDIEIVKHNIPAPTLLPETNITSNGFTANWNAVEGVDEYYFLLFANHTAQYDETFFFVDYDFSDIVSEGTTEAPETPVDVSCEYGAWFVFLPVYINNAIGVSGEFSEGDYYGYMSSPEYDLSSNNGTFSISLSLKGSTDDYITVSVYDKYGELADNQSISLPDNEWNEFSFQMENGDEKSVVEIVYYGSNYLFIDDFKVFQELPTGTKVTTPLTQKLCYETSIAVTIQEHYKYDDLFYQLYSIKNIYAYDSEYNEYYVSGAMYSDLTEPRFVTLIPENTESIESQSPAFAYFNEGELNIYNPNNEMVSIYNVNGVCIYKSMANGTIDLNIAKGLYIVKIGEKAIKAVN